MPRTRLESGLLADELVDVVDDIRREVHDALGTRPWKVEIITRRWSGVERGDGIATDSILLIDPNPLCIDRTNDRLGPTGREPTGTFVIEEVSLRYSEDELQPKVDNRTEVAYRLTDIRGTLKKPKWFVLAADPIARRGDKKGDKNDWYLVLRETSPMSNYDGVDS